MANAQPHRIKTINEFHQFRALPKPEHPLVSVINFENIKQLRDDEPKNIMLDFYSISLKRNINAKMKYGQQQYDFDDGIIAANYGEGDIIPWVSPIDIAAAIAEELTTPFTGRKVRYVASEELTCNQTAAILGAAIGKPDLKWIIITNQQMQSGLIAAGMHPGIAAGMVEMYGSLHNGVLAADYYRNKPEMGKVKLTDFSKEFAAAFNQK